MLNRKVSNSNFYYKDKTYQEIIDIIDKELPIHLKNNEDLINKIHQKYPLLTKSEIAVIVKGFFQCLRDVLVSNQVVHVTKLMCHVKWHFRKEKKYIRLFSYIFTPEHFK